MERPNTISRGGLRLAVFAAVVTTAPIPGLAQSAGWAGASPALAEGAPQPSGSGRLLGLRLPFSRFDASMDSAGHAYVLTMNPASHGRLRTTLEYRLAPRGPIGSLGLQTARDGPTLQSYDLDSAATAFGHQGQEARVGARISYRF